MGWSLTKKREIKITSSQLRNLRDRALGRYIDEHHMGLEEKCFWGKCALEATLDILDLDIKIIYPDTRGYEKKDK